MSHIVYDFLANSIFFNKTAQETGFTKESNARIEQELIDYRNYVIDNLEKIRAEINAKPSELNVFNSATDTPVSLLKQTALYLDQYVVSDSLFRLTNMESENEKAMSSYMGFPEQLNRKSILSKACYLQELTPMITGNFVKVFPATYQFEPPKQLPLKLPVDNNRGLLPPDILKFFREHSVVSPMQQVPDKKGWAVFDGKELKPCRAINIEFEGNRFENGFIYFLYESRIESVNEKDNAIIQRQYMPEYPPTQEIFDAWVEQSVNAAAKNYFDRSFGEVCLAESLGARYISDNPFKSELLGQQVKVENDIQSFTTNQVLNLDLPFLDKIDTGKLMEVRENEADTFKNFRLELERHFRELRLVRDEKDLKLKTENFFHEMKDVQGQKINQRLKHIQKQVFISSTMAIGGLAGTIATGGISLAALAIAAFKGFKEYNDYVQFIKENPAYFLWKVQQ